MTPDLVRFAQLAKPVLEWLNNDANSPEKDYLGFNMHYGLSFTEYDYKEELCDTVCCIAGAIIVFNNLNEYLDMDGRVSPAKIENLTLNFAEISDELNDLFYPPPEYDWREITPSEAYITLSNFIETGKVNWNHIHEQQMESNK